MCGFYYSFCFCFFVFYINVHTFSQEEMGGRGVGGVVDEVMKFPVRNTNTH